MGLGALHAISLADAREKAAECRKMLTNRIDPIDCRDAADAQLRLADARVKTFKECAEAYIEANKAGWRNPKHGNQWSSTLKTYAYPLIGDLPVQDIDTALVLKVIEPIWQTKTETASRVRGRIELILDWAATREYRQGLNPARWRGHLENLLPRRAKMQKVEHQPALPYHQIGDFMQALQKQDGVSAQALAFTILTAARTSEVIGARWNEVDLSKGLWTIPASRIKAGREHRVALSAAAVDLLRQLLKERTAEPQEWIFKGQRGDKHLSNMAMLLLLRRMNRTDITVHGFRSTFRDWCAEQTNFPREVAEAALAHVLDDKVEAAYRRSDLLDKRRQLMEAWGRYCAAPAASNSGDKVQQIRSRAGRA